MSNVGTNHGERVEGGRKRIRYWMRDLLPEARFAKKREEEEEESKGKTEKLDKKALRFLSVTLLPFFSGRGKVCILD